MVQKASLRLGESLAGDIALERRPLFITNLSEASLQHGFQSLIDAEQFSAYAGVPLLAKGTLLGVLEVFHREPFDHDQTWSNFLAALANQAAIAIDNAKMFSDLQKSHLDLRMSYDTTLEGWASALELRDRETEGHSQRVKEMTMKLSEAMGISGEDLVRVRRGALLHDIGKMGVPDSILHKPGPLNDEEWAIMHQHPVVAYNLLSKIAYLRPALDIPHYHHEKWDGSGYPDGLKGEQIPLAARIFAIVDVWDALSSDRSYRDAWPEEKVQAYLQDQAGKHFDPQVVEVFLKILP